MVRIPPTKKRLTRVLYKLCIQKLQLRSIYFTYRCGVEYKEEQKKPKETTRRFSDDARVQLSVYKDGWSPATGDVAIRLSDAVYCVRSLFSFQDVKIILYCPSEHYFGASRYECMCTSGYLPFSIRTHVVRF